MNRCLIRIPLLACMMVILSHGGALSAGGSPQTKIYAATGGLNLWVFEIALKPSGAFSGSYTVFRTVNRNDKAAFIEKLSFTVARNSDSGVIKLSHREHHCGSWQLRSITSTALTFAVSPQRNARPVRFGIGSRSDLEAFLAAMKDQASLSVWHGKVARIVALPTALTPICR